MNNKGGKHSIIEQNQNKLIKELENNNRQL